MVALPHPGRHLLSLLAISILLTSLFSIQTGLKIARGSDFDKRAHKHDRRDLASIHNNKSNSHTDLSSLHVSEIHPWLVRQQSHLANPTPCNTRLWFQNRTNVDIDCFPLTLAQVCRTPPGMGPEGLDASRLLQKIRPKYPSKPLVRNPRILCLVYTNEDNHKLVETIVHTWGKKCDGFLAMSNVHDASIGALALDHEGPESYSNMWQKTRSILKYAHDKYLDDFDFFHICGDDTYMILENMRAYLASEEVMELGKPRNLGETPTSFSQLRPLLLGAPMWVSQTQYACAGGSGYTLNQAALKLYANEIHNKCHVHDLSSKEDVLLSECFWNVGVKCSGWNVQERSTRYHGMDAQDAAQGVASPLGGRKLRKWFKIKIAEGFNGASPQSFAFHLKSQRFRKSPKNLRLFMMQRYEAIVYDLCPNHRKENADMETVIKT